MSQKTWLVPTICKGCAIQILAFRRLKEDDASIYISTLSNHMHLYLNSWRGRLATAWAALRGIYPTDIDLETMEDIVAFKDAVFEATRFVMTEEK